jgi:soluble cytochrome b562
MKFRTLASRLCFVPFLMVPAFGVEYGQPAPAPTEVAAPAVAPAPAGTASSTPEHKTPLAKDMDKIGSAMRKLRKQIDDPASNASSLALVSQVRAAAEAAAGETPAWAAEKPEADRAKFVADFRSDMKDFVGKVDSLAAALDANDNAAAAKIYKDLISAERDGHKEFRKPKPQQ